VQRNRERGNDSPGTTAWMPACVLALVALVALVAQSASAATIAVHTARAGDAIDIHASALLNADGATAWRVLTDYNRYPEFIPELRYSRVIARRDASVTVEQSGNALLWLFRMPIEVTFQVEESPPHQLHSHAVAGTLRALTSDYALEPASGGVRLDYVGHVTPGYALFGQIEQTVVERNIARQFQALADEIERQSVAARR
jgi:ribosome-associated toxin RatA of RatAB toxin-antitoxin module